MISDKYKCIFVHVPKTAGQSIEQVFVKLHCLTWETRGSLLLRPNDNPSKGPQALAHLKSSEYVDLGYIDKETFQSYYKFAFVRNPWERLVSEYLYRKADKKVSLKRFFESSVSQIDSFKDRSRHIIPQVEYLTDFQGNYIVDFVGRFETLTSNFARIAEHLGLGEVELERKNQSEVWWRHLTHRLQLRWRKPEKRPYQTYFDPHLRDRVGEFYAEDVARFGYQFDYIHEISDIVMR